jgi:hypothetical protein
MILSLLALVLSASSAAGDSARATDGLDAASTVEIPSPLHFLASAYGTLGGYSTSTDSRSYSGYVTLTNAWRDYYTLGFSSLSLKSSGAGKFYSQDVVTARASLFVSDRVALVGHYGYLFEGEISSYSSSAVFHWIGGGANYWFSYFSLAGISSSAAITGGKVVSSAFRGWYSFDVLNGIWASSLVVVTASDWSPRLFSFRQVVTVPVGNESSIIGWADVGRRGFYFDDESLIMYNQRSILRGSFVVKAIVRIVGGVYAIPLLQYDTLDDYDVKYASLGIRVVF